MTGGFASFDGTGKLDCAAKQQQFFGQRGFAGIRVGNDRECATGLDGVGNWHGSWLRCAASSGARKASALPVGLYRTLLGCASRGDSVQMDFENRFSAPMFCFRTGRQSVWLRYVAHALADGANTSAPASPLADLPLGR